MMDENSMRYEPRSEVPPPKSFGPPRYLLKLDATFIRDNESWFAVVDKDGEALCHVPMTADQARMFLDRNECEAISPTQWFRLICPSNLGSP